jgi:excisionase family DNA binding protein
MATVAQESPAKAPRYGSAAQVAAYAGLSVKTVRRLVEAGAVRGLKVGRRLLIPYADLDRHILRRAVAMAVVQPRPAEAAPYVPPISAEELTRRNARAVELLDSWMTEGDEQEQHETMAVLREALGPGRIASSRSAFR